MGSLYPRIGNHAIVMGGSMAGLLASRVLSDFYEKVTLIERDTLPVSASQRRGVPQGRHTHGLLASGGRVLEDFFPGISNALQQDGAVTGDISRDSRWFFEGACLKRVASGLNGLLMTRPMVEAAVRERVVRIANVMTRDNTAVRALATNGGTVAGVVIGDETLSADLVVDATGRGSHTPHWLETMGFPKPPEESVQVALGYTTRFFRRERHHLGGDIAVIIPPTPTGKRGGVMLAQEGDRWTVTLIAHFGNYAPEDVDGFVKFAGTLPAPYIHEVVSQAEPLGEPASSRFPASIRRRYESLTRFPEGYLVMGDAMCSFNPIYGQGMSVSALEAVELRKCLAQGSANLAKRFFGAAAKVVDIPWGIAAGNDLRMKEAVGRRTAAVKFINWYMSKLHKAAHTDEVPAMAFHNVGNLLAPPESVMHPRVMARVLLRNLGFVPRSAPSVDSRAVSTAE
ncbi:MAG TPA: hypothetical protein VKU01_06315 [Bryobacteraceae bacterium]|nr:hypothetical protein [Bryobacteraceae bacterium]